MDDKITIGQLPEIPVVDDATLIPCEDTGTAYKTTGAQWRQFVNDAVADSVADASRYAGEADIAADRAENAASRASAAEDAVTNLQINSNVLSAGATPTLLKTTSAQGYTILTFGLAPGAVGPQGATGPRGAQGVQGPRGDTGTAVAVETSGMFYFSVDNNSASSTFGHLFLTYSGNDAPNMSIVDGHLIWTVS